MHHINEDAKKELAEFNKAPSIRLKSRNGKYEPPPQQSTVEPAEKRESIIDMYIKSTDEAKRTTINANNSLLSLDADN